MVTSQQNTGRRKFRMEENTSKVNLQHICSANKYSLHPYVLFKKKLVKGCFVKGWPITNTVEMTNIPRANIKKKGDVAPSWIFEECSRFMFLILCYSNEAQLCLQFVNWSIPSFFFLCFSSKEISCLLHLTWSSLLCAAPLLAALLADKRRSPTKLRSDCTAPFCSAHKRVSMMALRVPSSYDIWGNLPFRWHKNNVDSFWGIKDFHKFQLSYTGGAGWVIKSLSIMNQ